MVEHDCLLIMNIKLFFRMGQRVVLTYQGHDNLLPKRVNRGAGDLGEALLEVVKDEGVKPGQTGQGSVVTHGPQRLLPVNRELKIETRSYPTPQQTQS